jgi:hypothetical protein
MPLFNLKLVAFSRGAKAKVRIIRKVRSQSPGLQSSIANNSHNVIKFAPAEGYVPPGTKGRSLPYEN